VSRQPGTSSIWSLLISGLQIGSALSILIGGHGVLIYQLWFMGGKRSGIEILAEITGLPSWSLQVCLLLALGMDVWIAYHIRKQRLEARRC